MFLNLIQLAKRIYFIEVQSGCKTSTQKVTKI